MPPRRKVFSQSGWKGMVYATDVGDVPEGYAWFARNMIPRAGVYWRRPSFISTTQVTSGVADDMGGLFVLQLPAGDITFACYAGEIYGTSAGGTTFSKLVSTANLSSASITLTTGGLVFGCQFGSVFVLNDSTNQPFTWDGTSGAGGLTKLTNAPATCWGAPTVSYGKLFFIKSASAGAPGVTIVWSEENAANTGYEAGTYSNAWTLSQMGQAPLFVILGLNDGLYYFRRNAIGVIRGTVTPDFQAAGVHDNVSLEVGSVSPKAVAYYDGWIWFLDSSGHPYRIHVGSYQLQPLWLSLAASFGQEGELAPAFSNPTAALFECGVLSIPAMHAVLFLTQWSPAYSAIPTVGSQFDGGYLFDATSGDCWCNVWIQTASGSHTPITNTGIVPGCTQAIASGAGRGIGLLVGNSAGANTGWYWLRFPVFGATAYSTSWPDGEIAVEVRSTPQGDVNAETRYHFSELRAVFVVSGVPSGTKTQAVLAQINTKASTSMTTLTSQNIANSGTGFTSERVTKTWGLARELPYLMPGIVVSGSSPAELAWGLTQLDVVAHELNASPAWTTT